jgi:ribosome-binding protein aMBF1 (putative translation factor)
VGKAAKYLGIKREHLKLQLFKQRNIPYYKVIGRSGKRIIRITKKDLDNFKVDQELYDRIADKIREARKEHVQIVKGISQADLARELKVTSVYMNYVENKKTRIGIKTLVRLAKILGKDLSWFLQ